MCISFLARYACGCLSPVATHTQTCKHRKQLLDFRDASADGDHTVQIWQCSQKCAAESRCENREYPGICPECIEKAARKSVDEWNKYHDLMEKLDTFKEWAKTRKVQDEKAGDSTMSF